MNYYHVVWLVLLFGWVANYMVRVAISPALIPMIQEFGINYATGGLLASFFFYGYSLMLMPAGYLGDRIGKKVVLTISSALWGVLSLLTSLASGFYELIVLRFLTGLAEGTYFGNDRPVIAAYTPKEKMAIGQGVSFTGLGLGFALGIVLGGLLTDLYGWRYAFLFLAIPPFIASALIGALIREPRIRKLAKRAPVSRLLRSRDLWIMVFAGIPIIYAQWMVGTWAPAIFVEMGAGDVTSSFFAALPGLAGVPGLLISGVISDRLVQRRRGRKALVATEMLFLALSLLLLGACLEYRLPLWIAIVAVLLSGFWNWGLWAPGYALFAELIPHQLMGTGFGLLNAVNFSGAFLAPWITGSIKDSTGSFAYGSYAAAGLVVLGAFTMLLIRPAFKAAPEIAMR